MNFDMPKAVFCGLALIAAAIFFGPGSAPATAQGGIQKIAICDPVNDKCARVAGRDNPSFWVQIRTDTD